MVPGATRPIVFTFHLRAKHYLNIYSNKPQLVSTDVLTSSLFIMFFISCSACKNQGNRSSMYSVSSTAVSQLMICSL